MEPFLPQNHKVVISIGGSRTKTPSGVIYHSAGAGGPIRVLHSRIAKSSKQPVRKLKEKATMPHNGLFLKTKLSVPSAGNTSVTSSGARVPTASRVALVHYNAYIVNQHTNNFKVTWTNDKVVYDKKHKNIFNLQEYGARNLIFGDV